jgi:hypothetical protein
LERLRPVQQRSSEVEAHDVGAALGQREGVRTMTAPNVNDASGMEKLKEIPKRPDVSPSVL